MNHASTVEDITPLGVCSEEHVAAARSILSRSSAAPDADVSMPGPDEPEQSQESSVQQDWCESRLPGRAWWDNVRWQSALTRGGPTLVQVPDRFRGAVETARAKALEVLTAAWDSGPAEPEWKLLLLFDQLLLARGRGGAPCAELLEERLAWSWA